MNQVQIYTLLNSHGFNESDAKLFVSALQEEDQVRREDLKDLEIKMLTQFQNVFKEMNNQTKIVLGGFTVVGTALGLIFKLSSLYFK